MAGEPVSSLIACPGNCSGNGACLSGTCLCQVQFAGWTCGERNHGYFISFGVLFYVLCATAFIQLLLCIRSDFKRLKTPSLYQACKLTIPKSLYVSIILAAASRAVYFTLELKNPLPSSFKENLFSTFYPCILSGFSLIICFWAESFHLTGLRTDKPGFLTKSFVGFVVFNGIVYTTLVAQVVSTNLVSFPYNMQVNEMFNGCFAFLMFVVLLFFLIYGVELFCKVEGAFKPADFSSNGSDGVNSIQLWRSRIGLMAQAAFQLGATMFLMTDVLGKFWKQNMSVGDRNIMDISFRVLELAVALWFPCCLWNASRPGDLWILNPQKLLSVSTRRRETEPLNGRESPSYQTFQRPSVEDATHSERLECSICYDPELICAGPLIRACDCKGDVGVVHHECLKRWLVEGAANGGIDNEPRCKVCNAKYQLAKDYSYVLWFPSGNQVKAWAQTICVAMTMGSLPVILFIVWDRIDSNAIKFALVGIAIIAEYVLLRLLGVNFLHAYKTMRMQAMKILGRPVAADSVTSLNSAGSSVSEASEATTAPPPNCQVVQYRPPAYVQVLVSPHSRGRPLSPPPSVIVTPLLSHNQQATLGPLSRPSGEIPVIIST